MCQIFGHRLPQQTAVTLFADDAHPTLATPEKEVEHQSYYGKEHQHQYPRHCLHRIAIVENDDDNRSDDSAEINNIKCYPGNLTDNGVPIEHSPQIIKHEANVGKTQKLSQQITEINIQRHSKEPADGPSSEAFKKADGHIPGPRSTVRKEVGGMPFKSRRPLHENILFHRKNSLSQGLRYISQALRCISQGARYTSQGLR